MSQRYDFDKQMWVEDTWQPPVDRPIEDLPKWPGSSGQDASPSASNERKEVTVTEQNKEVNIEDPTMLSAFFAKLSNKVVEASELGKRVAELETKLHNLQVQLDDAIASVQAERAGRLQVERDLQDVRNKLDHEQRAVHDLVVERDMERDAKGQAQTSLASTKAELDNWVNEAARLERERNEASHASDVCREQREQMAKQVAGLREAFAALRVIG